MVEHLEQHGAQLEHLESFPRRPVPRSDFDRAILRFVNAKARDGRDGLRDGRRAAMVAALEGRANYGAIRMWRRGQRPAPQWAKEMLAKKLEEYGECAKLLRR